MSEAIAAIGTKLYKGEALLPIAELTNIGGPKLAAEFLDVTSHDSVGGYREFIQTLRSGGDLPIEGNFIPSDEGQFALLTAFNDGSKDNYTIELPDEKGEWAFEAYVASFEMGAPFEGKLTFTASLKITGPAELTVGEYS
jgi:predicted secreted protein